MKERRSLVEGLKATPTVQELEEAFVFGAKNKPDASTAVPIAQPIAAPVAMVPVPLPQATEPLPASIQPDRSILPQLAGRVPVTTRCRPEIASALKRASLQRQLAGAEPYYVQDIMEEALEQWLAEHGYVN